MESYIRDNFIPVKIHIKEQPATFERFGAQWTPTILVTANEEKPFHRFEGFLPADDFLSHLQMGIAQQAFAGQQFEEAERRFRSLVDELPDSDAAPEALYWAGVANYKRTGEAQALQQTAQSFQRKYPQSSWAKRASVWAA